MTEIGNFLDGHRLISSSPFRSGHFLVVSLVGLGCVGVNVYIVFRHWHALTVPVALVLSSLVGLQLVYQWWRAFRYYAKMRQLYSTEPEETRIASPLAIALRIAAGGMINLLFFSYGMMLVALILIGALLGRLDAMR